MALNLYALRRNQSLSQAELAAKCHITQQFIQQIENGKRMPSLPVAKRIADALSVTVDELIGDENNPSVQDTAEPGTLSEKGA